VNTKHIGLYRVDGSFAYYGASSAYLFVLDDNTTFSMLFMKDGRILRHSNTGVKLGAPDVFYTEPKDVPKNPTYKYKKEQYNLPKEEVLVDNNCVYCGSSVRERSSCCTMTPPDSVTTYTVLKSGKEFVETDELFKKVIVTDLGYQYQIVVEEAIEVKDE
jgi:hypothetical protein